MYTHTHTHTQYNYLSNHLGVDTFNVVEKSGNIYIKSINFMQVREEYKTSLKYNNKIISLLLYETI